MRRLPATGKVWAGAGGGCVECEAPRARMERGGLGTGCSGHTARQER